VSARIFDALGATAWTAVGRALDAVGHPHCSDGWTLTDAAALAESQLRAVSSKRVVDEVRDALRAEGLAFAYDFGAEADAVRDIWTVRSIVDRGPRVLVSLESGAERVTIPVTETPRARVGQRVRVRLVGVRGAP